MLNRPLPALPGDIALLIGRVVLGVVLFAHGWQKLVINGISGTYGQFEKLGIPLAIVSASFTSFVEFVGGALLILGVLTTTVIALDLVVMVGAAGFVHITHGIFAQDGGWELVGVIVAAELALAAAGPGRFSVDHLIASRRHQEDRLVQVQPGPGGRSEPGQHAFTPDAFTPDPFNPDPFNPGRGAAADHFVPVGSAPQPAADWVTGSWDVEPAEHPRPEHVPAASDRSPSTDPLRAPVRATAPVRASVPHRTQVMTAMRPAEQQATRAMPMVVPRVATVRSGVPVGAPPAPSWSDPSWSGTADHDSAPRHRGFPAPPTTSGPTPSDAGEGSARPQAAMSHGTPGAAGPSGTPGPQGTSAALWAQEPAPMFRPAATTRAATTPETGTPETRTPEIVTPETGTPKTGTPETWTPPAERAARAARAYVPVPETVDVSAVTPQTGMPAGPVGSAGDVEAPGNARDLSSGVSVAARRALARRTSDRPVTEPTPFGVAVRTPLDFTSTSALPVTRPSVGHAVSAEYQPGDTEALPVRPFGPAA